MFSKYIIIGLVIALVIVGGAATVLGKLYVGAREDLAAQVILTEAANRETQKQIAENLQIRADFRTEQATTKDLLKQIGDIDVRHQKELRRIEKGRAAFEKAVTAAPERLGPVATALVRRGMRDICRSGGGSEDDCKTEPVRPGKARTGAAGGDRADRDHADGDAPVE